MGCSCGAWAEDPALGAGSVLGREVGVEMRGGTEEFEGEKGFCLSAIFEGAG